MKSFFALLSFAIFSSLAFANTSSPIHSDTEKTTTETQEVILTPVGFDKVLSMILFDMDHPTVEVELSQQTIGTVYKTSLKISETGVVEMDLNDFETGTYTLKVVVGSYTSVESLILP